MNFLIQKRNGRVKDDFSFALMDSCDYNNWYYQKDKFSYKLTAKKTEPGFVPIGSVEFVSKYLHDYYGLVVKPINIPEELMRYEFTGRNVINGTNNDIVGEKFVKSNDKIKSFTEICSQAPDGNYQISDVIDIDSEWRAFVYNSKLVGLNNYSGEFDIFPDVDIIRNMIKTYKSQPVAFTLDVGISDGKTVIIEVHDFFSCGLYGFSDHKVLPFMFYRWFQDFIKK